MLAITEPFSSSQVLDALTPKPDFVAPDLVDLAHQVLRAQREVGWTVKEVEDFGMKFFDRA
jgi:hypothetical protein